LHGKILRNVICLKQEKMKTPRKNNRDEAKKQLFNDLFQIQNEFEKSIDRYDLDALKMLRAMDELLETILMDQID
jgi:hypothetical protein